jgi:3',5'-cyclic AMP phosphodiesterase CpdA
VRVISFSTVLTLTLSACNAPFVVGPGDDNADAGKERVSSLPPMQGAPITTAEKRIQLTHTRMDPPDARSPVFPEQLERLVDENFAATRLAPGAAYDTHIARTKDNEMPTLPGPHATKLARFVHLADIQLADDESPARMAKLDGLGDTNGAFRPQEGHGCRILRSTVRTIMGLHRDESLDFVLLGGDNMDNAQHNEAEWVLSLLAPQRTRVECDSGDDDDLDPAGDDVKDPLYSSAMPIPYKWVTGNHDINTQGNFQVDDHFSQVAIGTNPELGTRDYRLPGAPVTLEPVPKDAKRALFSRRELLRRVAKDGDGHGIDDTIAETAKAIYAFDDGEIRVIVLDTSAESGGSEGIIRKSDLDAFILPLLEQALLDAKIVVLAAHHGFEQLTTDGGTLGFAQNDAVTPDEWKDVLDRFPNVVFSIVGHSHEHRVREIPLPSGRSFFEVMTSSMIDFPGQFRLVEIFDQDNGWLMLRATCVDYDTSADPLAEEGRQLMYIDYISGWGHNGTGRSNENNVELWIKRPLLP